MTSPYRVVVSFFISEALRDVVSGITSYVKEHQCNWQLLCVSSEEFALNLKLHNFDGALTSLRAPPRCSPKLVRQLRASGTPVVNLLSNLHPHLPSVLSDDVAIGRMGANYLHGLGFRQMAFVSLDTAWSRDREQGFSQRLKELRLPPPRVSPVMSSREFRFTSRPRHLKLIGKWAKTLSPHTAVMAPNDLVARTLLSVCQAEEIDVPGEVAILGVDNFLTLCELSPVTVSSIAQDFARVGYEAAGLLDRMMKGGTWELDMAPVLVPPGKLLARASTDVLDFEDGVIVDALKLIHEHAATGIRMSELLRKVPLSRKWLDHRFKKALGRTPTEEIRRCRLNYVRDLLVETEIPLAQIATQCRFSFPENLIRAFRSTFGMSPLVYRRKHRAIRR
ncbi:MAG TPA: substrate-binding domain-containing protein [Phycisphaerae bacterium]|jgi:LacI family transcriptional regulator